MNTLFTVFLIASGMMISSFAYSASDHVDGLVISKIRAVGDYASGTIYDHTIELWFTTSLVWSNTACTDTSRIYIDAKNQHIISAAYIAFSSGKKVGINADDTLPIRGGSCEISYLDVEA
ncbi:hypothetical protein R50072_03100 [Simiduia litorea]|uniref:hypothetical protein n=1 Tax=Simiduia litorea TaxID=1435348 RepID=UPI0036F1D835